MRYDAVADDFFDGHGPFATVTGARAKSEALANRHARAMKAVLLAAKAWGRSCRAENPSVDLEVRMLAAVNRLAKIEKEVSR